MQVYDAKGRRLDANVEIKRHSDGPRIVFESQGPGRNKDYITAFDIVLSRLAGLSATLRDATVVSKQTRHLSHLQKRLLIDDQRYPIKLAAAGEGLAAARALRRAAAAAGRSRAARGGGNPTKRVEIRFTIPRRRRAPVAWLTRQLLKPTSPDDELAVEDYIRPRARSSGQGRGLTQEERRIVELYAMRHAEEHYVRQGWHVEDVSSTRRSLDLLCTRKSRKLHVEVKGTTGYGNEILLTHTEVRRAREYFPNVALFVLAEVTLTTTNGQILAQRGKPKVFDPWRLALKHLEPRVYSLKVT
jgi:hypothetical protein